MFHNRHRQLVKVVKTFKCVDQIIWFRGIRHCLLEGLKLLLQKNSYCSRTGILALSEHNETAKLKRVLYSHSNMQ